MTQTTKEKGRRTEGTYGLQVRSPDLDGGVGGAAEEAVPVASGRVLVPVEEGQHGHGALVRGDALADVAALVLVECAGLTGGGHSLVAREGGEAKQALDL